MQFIDDYLEQAVYLTGLIGISLGVVFFKHQIDDLVRLFQLCTRQYWNSALLWVAYASVRIVKRMATGTTEPIFPNGPAFLI